jgi:uncharacterized protein (DUF697 family)
VILKNFKIHSRRKGTLTQNVIEETDSEFVGGIARDVGLILADTLGALIGGIIGAAIVSIVFIIIWWLLENGYR